MQEIRYNTKIFDHFRRMERSNKGKQKAQVKNKYQKGNWIKKSNQRLPWWFSGEESECQCKRHGSNHWSRKIPRVAEQLSPQLLSLCSRAWKPQLLKPMCPRAHAQQQEKPPQWEARTPQLEHSSYMLQLEKSLCSNKDPAWPKINKSKN